MTQKQMIKEAKRIGKKWKKIFNLDNYEIFIEVVDAIAIDNNLAQAQINKTRKKAIIRIAKEQHMDVFGASLNSVLLHEMIHILLAKNFFVNTPDEAEEDLFCHELTSIIMKIKGEV